MALKTVFVELKAKTDKFNKALKDADKKTNVFASSLKKVAIGVGGFFAARSLMSGIKGIVATAEAHGKLARSMGITMQQAAQLDYIAKRTSVGLNIWEDAAFELDRRLTNLADDKNLQKVFKALGLTSADLADLNGPEKTYKVLEEISRLPLNKQANALDRVFGGGAGKALLPLVRDGERLREVIGSSKGVRGHSEAFLKSIEKIKDLVAQVEDRFASMAGVLIEKALPGAEKLLNLTVEHFDTLVKVGATLIAILGTAKLLTSAFTILKTLSLAFSVATGTALAPILAIVAAVGSLVYLIQVVTENWDDLVRSFQWVGEKIGDWFGGFFKGDGNTMTPTLSAARTQAAGATTVSNVYNINAQGADANQVLNLVKQRERTQGRRGGAR